MPFGLVNAPATFQSMKGRLFQGMKFVCVYLDDIVVHSKSITEHLTHLEELFKKLASHGFRMKLKKCHFLRSRIKLLGHIADKDGVSVDKEKIDTTRSAPVSRTRSQLRSFLGLASYHRRRFINRFAKIARPLHENPSVNVEWTDAMTDAFKVLRKSLFSAAIVACPRHEKAVHRRG